ncbi:MAG: hypothetical protein LBP86_11815, partial [Azoarcus sp.]|nr:hypothetical protein [Azoarcus sp.]
MPREVEYIGAGKAGKPYGILAVAARLPAGSTGAPVASGHGACAQIREMMTAMEAHSQNHELIAVFTRTGFCIEEAPTQASVVLWHDEALAQAFRAQPCKTLYDFGYSGRAAHMSPSMAFLKTLAERFVHEVSHDGDLALTRRAARADAQVFLDLLRERPYAVGAEYI